jgi:hypothetical protein
VFINIVNESIIVPIYKKGQKTDCSNYGGISLVYAELSAKGTRLLVKNEHTSAIANDA